MDIFPENKKNKLLVFPIIFGLLGGIMGLFLRYVFTGAPSNFLIRNILHSHSHTMLLGFVFNALIALLWIQFTTGIDKKSYFLYLCLQACVSILLVGFLFQGYTVFTIIFSTLHLWLSYSLLIQLWKNLAIKSVAAKFVKIGIVLHFIASIGPYALGPLKVLELQDSPWYQQAIFFYLHFQYFGSFFMWFLGIFLQQTKIKLSNTQIILVVLSCVFLYAHSLDYHFNHYMITSIGGIAALLLFSVFFSKINSITKLKLTYKILYLILLTTLAINCLGSIPFLSTMLVSNRFILIAWLHLLFLGLYLPFIWVEFPIKISPYLWLVYALLVSTTELLLVFPNVFATVFSTSIMWLLFLAYLGVVFCICIVHLNYIFERIKR